MTAVTRHLAIDDDELAATGPGGDADVEPAAYDTVLGGAVPPVAEGRYPQGPNEVALGAATATASVRQSVTASPSSRSTMTSR